MRRREIITFSVVRPAAVRGSASRCPQWSYKRTVGGRGLNRRT